MAAGILLYGVSLDDDAEWNKFYESHHCRLSAATKVAARRKQVKVKHPAFRCTIVGAPGRFFFITVPESCILATGRDVTPVERLEVGPDWDKRLASFCDLFDLGRRKFAWYLTDIGDGEHKGRQNKE